MVAIDLDIVEMNPDPTQYKKFSTKFQPASYLMLRLDVPDKYIVEQQDGVQVINLEGLKYIQKTLAVTIAATEQQYYQESK
jgi:hypothetical protein